MKNVKWSYSERINQDRQEYLRAVGSFEEIVQMISDEVTVNSYTVDFGRKIELSSWRRPVFLLQVSAVAFDKFFNSPCGYRAQYCINPENGIRENNRLIFKLFNRLIDYACEHPQGDMKIEEIKRSLYFTTAKIWIKEKPGDVPSDDELLVDIQNPIWVKNAQEAFADDGNTNPDAIEQHKAVRGVMAPMGTLLEVKGGWFDANGVERHDPEKVDRVRHIQQYGFS